MAARATQSKGFMTGFYWMTFRRHGGIPCPQGKPNKPCAFSRPLDIFHARMRLCAAK